MALVSNQSSFEGNILFNDNPKASHYYAMPDISPTSSAIESSDMRPPGIEPRPPAWKAGIIPLDYRRNQTIQ